MALIYEPKIFREFPNVRAAMTLRGRTHPPYGFNMSLSVGDDPTRVLENRGRLARRLGFDPDDLKTQKQVHGNRVRVVEGNYRPEESDALVTARAGALLAISIADCVPVLLYDTANRAVAGVHSGWRGSLAQVTERTVTCMVERFGTEPEHLAAFIGAAAGQCCYEVGEDVSSVFPARYSREFDSGKKLFDNKGVVLDQLRALGVPSRRIELDERCTICDPEFHSFRRDGARSGRMFAAIGLIE